MKLQHCTMTQTKTVETPHINCHLRTTSSQPPHTRKKQRINLNSVKFFRDLNSNATHKKKKTKNKSHLKFYHDHNSLTLLKFHLWEFVRECYLFSVMISLLQPRQGFRQSLSPVLQFLYQQMQHNPSYKQSGGSLSICQFHSQSFHPSVKNKQHISNRAFKTAIFTQTALQTPLLLFLSRKSLSDVSFL